MTTIKTTNLSFIVPVTIGFAATMAAMLSGCDSLPWQSDAPDRAINGGFSFTSAEDEFSGLSTFAISGEKWIDETDGKSLEYRFECTRGSDAVDPSEIRLLVQGHDNTEYDNPLPIDAVLYRVGDNPVAQHPGMVGQFSSSTRIELDMMPVLATADPANPPDEIQFRFVYGAGAITAISGDMNELLRAPAVDLKLDFNNRNVDAFLLSCFNLSKRAPS